VIEFKTNGHVARHTRLHHYRLETRWISIQIATILSGNANQNRKCSHLKIPGSILSA